MRAGATVVYPEGTPATGTGWGWAAGTSRFSTSGVDDVAFLAEVVDRIGSSGCLGGAVLVTGESNGAAMAVRAWCSGGLREAVSMVAPVIPAVGSQTVSPCAGGHPVKLVAVVGEQDRVAPYDGTADGALLGQEEWFSVVADANGCNGEGEEIELTGATLHRPARCARRTELVAVHDGVHTWPGGPTGTAGLDPGAFQATAYLWSAFATP